MKQAAMKQVIALRPGYYGRVREVGEVFEVDGQATASWFAECEPAADPAADPAAKSEDVDTEAMGKTPAKKKPVTAPKPEADTNDLL